MARIQVLDQITIDKIAAGEVIERPAAVVKELVENAIDADATEVTIEIKEGGIAFIRIKDDGKGIPKAEIPKAFLRHATSKIRSIEDLSLVHSLGFRGEALSSIASVAQVEVHTICKEEIVGSAYVIHGGIEKSLEPAAVNKGTTFLVRQLFYNIPARRKFLKTASTEASRISELVTRLALSHPDVSFQFINNGSLKLHTSGNGRVKDVIYHIYGRDIANNLIEINHIAGNIKITGYIGKPEVSRGNRNYENYFINGRYVKSGIISKALEDAYKGYSMQHRYPFTVLHIEMDTNTIDVNVHPTKMELRFIEQNMVYNVIYSMTRDALSGKNMIPEVELPSPTKVESTKSNVIEKPDVIEENQIASNEIKTEIKNKNIDRLTDKKIICKPHKNTSRYGSSLTKKEHEENLDYFIVKMQDRVASYHERMSSAEVEQKTEIFKKDNPIIQNKIREAVQYAKDQNINNSENIVKDTLSSESKRQSELEIKESNIHQKPNIGSKDVIEQEIKQNSVETNSRQLNMFEEHMIESKVSQEYRMIGQVFSTYWMIEYKEQLYIIDQHAAHEKVLYESTMKNWKNKSFDTQYISPPIVLTLSMQELELLENNIDKFTEIGFELESFGSDAYAIRGVPSNLFSIAKKELFIDMLDELTSTLQQNVPTERVLDKIASMSCKAAVKGKQMVSATEMEHLITQLLELENPFHCPHGRPTIIAISKKEMEKKFKRII